MCFCIILRANIIRGYSYKPEMWDATLTRHLKLPRALPTRSDFSRCRSSGAARAWGAKRSARVRRRTCIIHPLLVHTSSRLRPMCLRVISVMIGRSRGRKAGWDTCCSVSGPSRDASTVGSSSGAGNGESGDRALNSDCVYTYYGDLSLGRESMKRAGGEIGRVSSKCTSPARVSLALLSPSNARDRQGGTLADVPTTRSTHACSSTHGNICTCPSACVHIWHVVPRIYIYARAGPCIRTPCRRSCSSCLRWRTMRSWIDSHGMCIMSCFVVYEGGLEGGSSVGWLLINPCTLCRDNKSWCSVLGSLAANTI